MTQPIQRRKIKYLNNHDLVKEINKSKMSYCWVAGDEFKEYDDIITKSIKVKSGKDTKHVYSNPSVQEIITYIEYNLEEAKSTRLNRINNSMVKNIQKALNITAKKAEEFVGDNKMKTEDIKDSDVVFRVVTYEHIPDDIRDNNILHMIPFKHFTMVDGKLVEVARSHWKGDLETGNYDPDRGKITEPLAKMMIKLVTNYSNKSNYKYYSYVDEMVGAALLQLSRSALLFDEAKAGAYLNPFAYLTTICTNSFTSVLNKEKRSRDLRDDLLIEHGLAASNTRQLENELNIKANQ